MKVINAIKKVEQITGETVGKDDCGRFIVTYKGYTISFFQNGRDGENITCIYTIRVGLKDDSMTDYFPGTFHDNLTQAFAFVDRQAEYKATQQKQAAKIVELGLNASHEINDEEAQRDSRAEQWLANRRETRRQTEEATRSTLASF